MKQLFVWFFSTRIPQPIQWIQDFRKYGVHPKSDSTPQLLFIIFIYVYHYPCYIIWFGEPSNL